MDDDSCSVKPSNSMSSFSSPNIYITIELLFKKYSAPDWYSYLRLVKLHLSITDSVIVPSGLDVLFMLELMNFQNSASFHYNFVWSLNDGKPSPTPHFWLFTNQKIVKFHRITVDWDQTCAQFTCKHQEFGARFCLPHEVDRSIKENGYRYLITQSSKKVYTRITQNIYLFVCKLHSSDFCLLHPDK